MYVAIYYNENHCIELAIWICICVSDRYEILYNEKKLEVRITEY